jgi:hypothetical protein
MSPAIRKDFRKYKYPSRGEAASEMRKKITVMLSPIIAIVLIGL